MAALKLFQSILGPRGPTSKKTSMAAFKGTQDTLGPRFPTPPKKQMLAYSRCPVRPLGGEGGSIYVSIYIEIYIYIERERDLYGSLIRKDVEKHSKT